VLAKAQRTESGYRVYPAETLERVNMIRQALRLGFSLAELAEILRTRDRGGVPCSRVLGMLEGKLDLLDEQITDLKHLRKSMTQIVSDWKSKLDQSEPGTRVHLLDSIIGAPAPKAKNGYLQRRRKRR